MTDFRRFEF